MGFMSRSNDADTADSVCTYNKLCKDREKTREVILKKLEDHFFDTYYQSSQFSDLHNWDTFYSFSFQLTEKLDSKKFAVIQAISGCSVCMLLRKDKFFYYYELVISDKGIRPLALLLNALGFRLTEEYWVAGLLQE